MIQFKTDGTEIRELFNSDCAPDPILSLSSLSIFFLLFLITQCLTSITDKYSLNFYQSHLYIGVYVCLYLSPIGEAY